MHDSLYRLTYYSRNLAAGTAEDMTRTIDQILASSRRNNPLADITGALMFNGGCFAQVLEGPKSALENTFERIQQDARHGEVSLLSFGPIEKRAFDRWSMAFVGASALHTAQFGEVGAQTGYSPGRMSGDTITRMLHRLVLEEEAMAS